MALSYMRRHRRWLFGFLWIVIAAFIILYIPAFQGAGAGSLGESAAEVGGQIITVSEYQKAYLDQRRRLEQQFQGQLDEEMVERLGLKDQVLNAMIEHRLVLLEARRLGLRVDDQEMARAISQIPGFAGAAEVRRRLALQGVSEEDFAQQMRDQLLGEKLQSLITDGVTVSPAEAEREFRRRNEQVKVEYVLVSAAPFRAQAAVSDDEVKARFEADKEKYRLPEKRVIAFLAVDPVSLQARAAVSDREIQSYYEEHRDDFKQKEQACARHILIKVKTDPAAKEGHAEDEARKIAQGLLDQVKGGADFAELAKKHSEDPGSAANGGDLSCFPRGQMVPEFDDAAFSMQPGQTSDLVKTVHGFHIIRVQSKREEMTPALSVVKERVRQILVGQRVRALADEKIQAVAASLRRGRSLEEAGREQGVTVQKSGPLARGETAPGLESPLATSRAFELKKGESAPDPLGAPGGGAVFVSVADVQASRLPELKEVQDKVKADLTSEKALALARAKAQEVRSRADKDGLDKAASALGLTRKETPNLVGRGQPMAELGTSGPLEDAVYALPEKTLSDPVPAAGGWAVVRVLEKKAFDPVAFAKEKDTLVDGLRQQKQDALFRAYMNQVKQRFPVERRPEAVKRAVG